MFTDGEIKLKHKKDRKNNKNDQRLNERGWKKDSLELIWDTNFNRVILTLPMTYVKWKNEEKSPEQNV